MQDSTLLKTALTLSFGGIIILFILSNVLAVEQSKLSTIQFADDNSDVSITGTIQKVTSTPELTILQVMHPETVKVIFQENISIKKGSQVHIEGTITRFNGKNEIQADMIFVEE
jgi:hypothetical protein